MLAGREAHFACTKIKDLRSVYLDTDGKLLLRVDGTQQLDNIVESSQQNYGTTTYSCEVCHKFQGDSKAMRQHIARHDLQSADDWFNGTKIWNLSSHECCAVFETCMVPIQKRTQAPCQDAICDLRAGGRNLHTIARWSRRRNPTPEPSLNVLVQCHGCKKVFWNGIYTNTFPTIMPIRWWWPLLQSQVSQFTRTKDIMSRVSARIRDRCWLPSVSKMIRTHTNVIVHFNIHTHNKNEVTCAHKSILTWISTRIYLCC